MTVFSFVFEIGQNSRPLNSQNGTCFLFWTCITEPKWRLRHQNQPKLGRNGALFSVVCGLWFALSTAKTELCHKAKLHCTRKYAILPVLSMFSHALQPRRLSNSLFSLWQIIVFDGYFSSIDKRFFASKQ